MWICKENMKEIAEKLDHHKTLKELGIDEDVVMNMAYQLQYFFEAKEMISTAYRMSGETNLKWYEGLSYAVVSLDKAVIEMAGK